MVHWSFIRKVGAGAQKDHNQDYTETLLQLKDKVSGQERSWLDWMMWSRVYITSVTHFVNVTELYQEEFRDNLCFW